MCAISFWHKHSVSHWEIFLLQRPKKGNFPYLRLKSAIFFSVEFTPYRWGGGVCVLLKNSFNLSVWVFFFFLCGHCQGVFGACLSAGIVPCLRTRLICLISSLKFWLRTFCKPFLIHFYVVRFIKESPASPPLPPSAYGIMNTIFFLVTLPAFSKMMNLFFKARDLKFK